MPIDYTQLKAEITTDARGYGYAAPWNAGSDDGVAALLNLVRDGTAATRPATPTADGGQATGLIQVKRAEIAAVEILEAIDTRDFKASPTVLEGAWLQSITQAPAVRFLNEDGTDTRVKANLQRIVSANTNGSQTRLGAIAQEPGSRFLELSRRNGWGVTACSGADVARARQA